MPLLFTINNPTGKNGYAHTLSDAISIAGAIGGGYIWKIGDNLSPYSKGLGWFDASKDCTFEVCKEPKVWPYPKNVSSAYY